VNRPIAIKIRLLQNEGEIRDVGPISNYLGAIRALDKADRESLGWHPVRQSGRYSRRERLSTPIGTNLAARCTYAVDARGSLPDARGESYRARAQQLSSA